MSTLDSFVTDFQRGLDKIDQSSLQQWQFAYKKVIFAMGLKILEHFPQNAFGPQPVLEARGSGGGQGGGGQAGGGEHTGAGGGPLPTKPPTKGSGPFAYGGGPGQGPIIHIAIAALDLAPPPPPPSS